MKKTMKLVFKGNAADEVKNGVKITFGMEFSRLFKQSEQPFQVDRRIGNAILRNYDFFTEFEEVSEDPAPTMASLTALKRGELDVLAVKTYGIENAAALANKETVATAILQALKAGKSVPAEKAEDPTQSSDDDSQTANESSDEKSEESSNEQG